MNITEVRIKLMDEAPNGHERLEAFASIVIDDAFAVRDLKVIRGHSGLVVAMPARRLTDRCPGCGGKNHLQARYCNACGGRLGGNRALDGDGKAKLFADVSHPINAECREAITAAVLDALAAERAMAARPGYRCRYTTPGPLAAPSPAPSYRTRPAPLAGRRVATA